MFGNTVMNLTRNKTVYSVIKRPSYIYLENLRNVDRLASVTFLQIEELLRITVTLNGLGVGM